LQEPVEVDSLALFAGVAVADEQRQVGVLRGELDTLGDVVEERVGAVEHHVREGAAGTRPQLACRLVAHEAQLGHGALDPLPGAGADHLGPVHHVGDRAEGDAGRAGDVLDGRCPAVAHGYPLILKR
jgi:hypothetical protein